MDSSLPTGMKIGHIFSLLIRVIHVNLCPIFRGDIEWK